MKYRKKPVVIEARQWDGSTAMAAYPNDWIIKGIKGEFYPCKPTALESVIAWADADDNAGWRLYPEEIAAARRELAILRELAEADDAVDEMKFVGSMTDAIEHRAKARDAYRAWKAEQESQS